MSSPHGSKLASPSSSSSLADASSSSEGTQQTGSRSGLKQPSGGRMTPGFSGRATPSGDGTGKSGIARPSSRLTKPGTIHEKTGTTKGEDSVVAGGSAVEGLHNGPSEQVSKLRLMRKGSDGASKRIKIEAGTSSLPRHLPKGIIDTATPSQSTSRLSPLNSSRKHISESVAPTQGSSEDASTSNTEKSASERLHAAENGDGTRPEGPKRGLRRPGVASSGSLGLGVRTPNISSESPAPSTASATTATANERTHPIQKSGELLPSRLTRGGSGLKLLSERKLPPPQQVLKPQSKAGRDYSSSSTSSLDSNSSGDIATVQSSVVDAGKEKLHSEDTKRAPTKKQAGVPAQLNLPSERNGESEKSDEPSKELQSSSKSPKSHPNCSRRTSPEGMSHEEIVTSPKAETSDGNKTVVEQKNLKNEKELEKGKGSDGQVVINGDLSPEQKRVAKTSRDAHSATIASPSEAPASDAKESVSDQRKEKPPSTESTNKSFSQPETGQLYSDSMAQLSPETKRSAVSPGDREGNTEQQHGTSGTPELEEVSAVKPSSSHQSRTHAHAKRARSLSPNNSRRIFPLPLAAVLAHESTSSQPTTPASLGVSTKMDFSHTSALARTRSSDDQIEGAHKPLRSSLRNSKRAVVATSSSSSLDNGHSKSHHSQKVRWQCHCYS